MPTTANGTPYTVRIQPIPGHGWCHYGVADANYGGANVPALLYCHGNGGAANQFSALSAWAGMRDWLIDNGWAWIEGTGGGASSWGNQAARNAYEAYVTYVSGVMDLGQIVVLGRSMGGLVSYWLATQSAVVAPSTVGLIVNSGTTDLAYRYSSDPDQTLLDAFGATDGESFAANTLGFDPMLFPESEWIGTHVLQMYGTADTTVPPTPHALAWLAKYGSHTETIAVDIREGGDHSATNGSYLQTDAMTTFLVAVSEVGELPPMPQTYQILAMYYVMADGRDYPMEPVIDL